MNNFLKIILSLSLLENEIEFESILDLEFKYLENKEVIDESLRLISNKIFKTRNDSIIQLYIDLLDNKILANLPKEMRKRGS